MRNLHIKNKRKWLGILLVIAIIAVAGMALFNKGPEVLTPEDQVKKAEAEATEVKASLAKHLEFPEGDEPDIRKIREKVADPFFTKAEVGDYLIIFHKSRIAYIYSMEKNIIVNAGVVFTNLPGDQNKKGVDVDAKVPTTATTTSATTTKR